MSIDPVLGTLAGTLLGMFGAFLTNIHKKRADEKDALRKRTWEKEDRDISELKDMKNIKYEVYNNILMKDGEVIIVTNAGNRLSFDFISYSKEIRPLLFKKYHLLDLDVKDKVKKMDKKIAAMAFNEEATGYDEDDISSDYYRLIEMIENKYEDQKKL
ncbi:hypothetical protein [Paenibacillus macquariensis]|uniref:Uncharacterized protein n=1 Tax=Paenibacillus macquariensis TaxID=948756 RepID=A0ABY1JKE0_9BACL|nr:hypothetical protein [Paenibacillus macquariensis]MEC0089911.1 hypothetical protein [Paenibacillus macquariensis]OAB31197.1 hypothetical protein PMSM_20985 [Paenibacillus macquariensis subsp. macquariensis]SIQ34116.1 hypothetical protein SAMN05421578_101297 [Paenibacillus macquariensis]